jgi:hypothetical protein
VSSGVCDAEVYWEMFATRTVLTDGLEGHSFRGLITIGQCASNGTYKLSDKIMTNDGSRPVLVNFLSIKGDWKKSICQSQRPFC